MILRTITIAGVVLICLLVSSCGSNPPISQQASNTVQTSPHQEPTQTTRLPIAANPTRIQPQPQAAQSEYHIVPSLKERIATSKIIIIGIITDEGEVINAARDTSDRTQPATNLFGVGQVYHVRAIRYLKGTGESTLNIFQVEGIIDREPTTVTQNDIVQAKASYAYTPFQIGATYLFFLNPYTWADLKDTYFVGDGGFPWRFVLTENGEIKPEGPIGSLAQPGGEFAPRPITEFTTQVEQLVQAEKTDAPTK